jgi:hypothetical protein
VDYSTEACAILFELLYNKLCIFPIYRSPTCVILFELLYNKLCIFPIYGSPTGNFTNFLNQLDLIFQTIYNIKYNIICGDINVNVVFDNSSKNQVNAVLHTHILFV